jgi:hypothetical protein
VWNQPVAEQRHATAVAIDAVVGVVEAKAALEPAA